LILETLPYIKYYVKQDNRAKLAAVNHRNDSSSVIHSKQEGIPDGDPSSDLEPLLFSNPVSDQSFETQKSMTVMEIFQAIKNYALSVWGTFALTLFLFPGVTAKMAGTGSSRFSGDIFVPFLFLVFNVGDLCGRVAASWRTLINPKYLWVFVTLRLVFIPLFLLCNKSSSGGVVDFAVFGNDAWPVIFMAIFSISNGYLGSQTMMYGPSQVGTYQPNQAKAGTFMAFCLSLGIFVGSVSSFALVPLTG